MEQRLNIEVIKEGKVVGNCYYHWSAYTLASLDKASQVIEKYDKLIKQNLPDEVLVVKLFENCTSYNFFLGKYNHAGLSQDSYQYMSDKYPNYDFLKATDRNAGLIGVTDKDINETRSWEEGFLIIDLDEKIIDTGMMFDYLEVEEYEQEYIDNEEEFNLENIPEFQYDNLGEIPFNNLKKVIDEISRYEKERIFTFKSKDGSKIITLIA